MQEAKRSDIIQQAEVLADHYNAVVYNGEYYIPEDYETGFVQGTAPAPERTRWRKYQIQDLVLFGNQHFGMTYLGNMQSDLLSACIQHATQIESTVTQLLIKHGDQLNVLHHDGSLRVPTGSFVPNLLPVALNEDADDKQLVRDVIFEWVGFSSEQYTSLMHHLATVLAPGWSINRYVLLLGAGRNGKSVLMSMLQKLLGPDNYSQVTRQHIAGGQSEMLELNSKLLNVIMDGPATFISDSGNEKTLIAGEALATRKRYANHLDTVQTNALFIEGLNSEPRTNDTSSALQARLVRFEFPNTYPDNAKFFKHMTSEPLLGALLSLLIDHFVTEDDPHGALKKTVASMKMQLAQSLSNDLAMQFLLYIENNNPGQSEDILKDMWLPDLAKRFTSWTLSHNDLTARTDEDVRDILKSVVKFKRGSKRHNGVMLHPLRVDALTPAGQDLLDAQRTEDTNASDTASVVED